MTLVICSTLPRLSYPGSFCVALEICRVLGLVLLALASALVGLSPLPRRKV